MQKPDSHEGSPGDTGGGGADGNVGEERHAGSGRSCGSWGWLRPGCTRPLWNPPGAARKGRHRMSHPSSGQKLEAANANFHLLFFGLWENKQGIVTLASASPGVSPRAKAVSAPAFPAAPPGAPTMPWAARRGRVLEPGAPPRGTQGDAPGFPRRHRWVSRPAPFLGSRRGGIWSRTRSHLRAPGPLTSAVPISSEGSSVPPLLRHLFACHYSPSTRLGLGTVLGDRAAGPSGPPCPRRHPRVKGLRPGRQRVPVGEEALSQTRPWVQGRCPSGEPRAGPMCAAGAEREAPRCTLSPTGQAGRVSWGPQTCHAGPRRSLGNPSFPLGDSPSTFQMGVASPRPQRPRRTSFLSCVSQLD